MKKIKKKPFPRWLTLVLLKNCFSDGEKTHLGIKFRGHYYCITHSATGSQPGIEIPKEYLKMKNISEFPEYLKQCTTEPVTLYSTSMKINEIMLTKALLQLQMNKI